MIEERNKKMGRRTNENNGTARDLVGNGKGKIERFIESEKNGEEKRTERTEGKDAERIAEENASFNQGRSRSQLEEITVFRSEQYLKKIFDK